MLAYEDFVDDIDRQSQVEITPAQLACLVHHMQQCVFEKVKPARLKFNVYNHNHVMRRLKSQMPHLFKELPTGEITLVDFEERSL
jgi:hypothetical protein